MSDAGRPEPLAQDLAYQHVRAAIMNSGVAGRFVSEGKFAAELGLSRTPVREALLRLEAEHLLQIVPKKGAYIPPVTREEIRDVMEARMVIETFCYDKALQEGRERVLDRAVPILDEQQRYAADGPATRFVELDREFHTVIVQGSSNSVLLSMYRALRDQQIRVGLQAVVNDPQRSQQVMEEHRAIVEAFREDDAGLLREATQIHLVTTLKLLLDVPS